MRFKQAAVSLLPGPVRRAFSYVWRNRPRILASLSAIRTWPSSKVIGPAIKVARVGNDYGGGWVALSLLQPGGLVYSVGVGEEISFDLELSSLVACTIVGIDPTPRSAQFIAQYANLPPGYSFVQVGLAPASGRQRFYFPANPEHVSMSLVHDSGAGHIDCEFLALEDLMARLGHEYVDMLKIDVEGAEYDLIESWLSRHYSPPCGQLWMEFHPERASKTAEQTKELAQRTKALGLAPLHDGKNGYLFLNTQSQSVSLLARLRFCVAGTIRPV